MNFSHLSRAADVVSSFIEPDSRVSTGSSVDGQGCSAFDSVYDRKPLMSRHLSISYTLVNIGLG